MKPDDARADRILLIEGDRDIAATVGDYLERSGFRVDRMRDEREAWQRVLAERYDAVVVDLVAERMDGPEFCRRLRREDAKHPPVLVLAGRDERILGLDACGDDSLGKPFALQELEARLRTLIQRERRSGGEVLHVGDLALDTATLRATRAGRELQLSPIGLKLLALLMRESPQTVSRRDLEREIWGDAVPGSDALRSHLYLLRKAIDKPFDTALLHTIHGAGYRLAELESQAAQRAG